MPMTTQQQVRAAFWRTVDDYNAQPEVPRFNLLRKKPYNTDTRCAFVDYVGALQRDGEISEALAQRVTL